MTASTPTRGEPRVGPDEAGGRRDLERADGEASRRTGTSRGSARKRSITWRKMRRSGWMYALMAPGFAYFLLFHYVPLAGNAVAFQDYSPFLGIRGSQWVGWTNFVALVTDPQAINAIKNTLIISLLQIAFAFPAPILLALLLNSLVSTKIKRFIQSVVYLPHFISWVIIVSIWQDVLGGTGPITGLLASLGLGHINIMTNPSTFKLLVTVQVIWKDIGWGTIIFFAAMLSIPSELYESAACDRAGALRRMWHVTLPGILPVTLLLLILRLGHVLSVGFEQIILQQPAVGVQVSDVLDTFVYNRGLVGGDWGIATAAGLVKGVIGTALVLGANKLAKRAGTEGLF